MKPTQDQSSLIIASIVTSVMIHLALFGGVVSYVVYSEPVEEEDPVEKQGSEDALDQEVVISGEQPYIIGQEPAKQPNASIEGKSEEQLREEQLALALALLEKKEKEKG